MLNGYVARGMSRRQAMVAGLAASGALAGAFGGAQRANAKQAASAYSIDEFFGHEGSKGVALSSGGTRLAVLHQKGQGEGTSSIVTVHDASDPTAVIMRLPMGEMGVNWVSWSGDDVLLVSAYTPAKTFKYRPSDSNRRESVEGFENHRVISINVATRARAVMFQQDRERLRYSPYLGTVTSFLPDDPDHILMPSYERDGSLGLFKVNIHTGQARLLEAGNRMTLGWHVHDGIPVLRRDINTRFTVETWFARLPQEKDWRVMRRNRVRDAPEFHYLGQGPTQEQVRVRVWVDGDDALSVRDMSLRDFSVGAPVLPKADRDATGGLYDTRGKWLGTSYYGERVEYVFEDADLSAHHAALDSFFDNDCDIVVQDVSADRNRLIAYVAGPREPGLWVFYDRAARNITPMGTRTMLDYERLSEGRLIKVATRDGAEIEAYLTVPLSGQPGPLVVLPHGGPEVRDYRRYDRQAQVFAAQGWWVLQPNFRGSGGYGKAFAKAGWTRWGDRMQEDVEDAVAQVIAQNALDANKVAIVGTSYGGYAALMGAVRRPELYKAAISICGVGDLVEMLQWVRRNDDTPGDMIYDFWTKRIGDLSTQREAIEAASPNRQAAKIMCPVLLVHGTEDKVVPINQSKLMQRALQAAGKSVAYVEVDGGHADWNDAEELRLMKSYVEMLSTAFA